MVNSLQTDSPSRNWKYPEIIAEDVHLSNVIDLQIRIIHDNF